jgi:beta-lactamase superfamily II metal-dependent hydrolase
MKSVLRGSLLATVLVLALPPARAVVVPEDTLDIYFIDVEGGQSTLVVTPAGQSLLIDAGFAGFENRDPLRIRAAMRAAGLTQIDFLLITHFHWDHDGGVPELARRVPIRTFIDHGDLERTPEARAGSAWAVTLDRYNAYRSVRAGHPHLTPEPGDRLPLRGVDVTVVSADRATIAEPLPGAGQVTPGCDPAAPDAADPFENPRSTGFLLRFGRFRFLNLGDLSGAPLFSLVCPRSLIGAVDVYLVPHHGGRDATYPATFAALRPRVAIVNNGATKGGAPETFINLQRAPGLEAAWQLHTSMNEGAVNLPESQSANLDESTAHWIKVSASEDGSFTVTNARTGGTTSFASPAPADDGDVSEHPE